MPTMDEVKAQVKALGGNTGFGAPEEIKDLPKLLQSDERIIGFIHGKVKGSLGVAVATERRLIFINTRAGLLRKVSSEDFSYDKITSVRHDTGLELTS